jgi:hypothetical protein
MMGINCVVSQESYENASFIEVYGVKTSSQPATSTGSSKKKLALL